MVLLENHVGMKHETQENILEKSRNKVEKNQDEIFQPFNYISCRLQDLITKFQSFLIVKI